MHSEYRRMSLPHILVFDSGIGGTSILSSIQHDLPGANYTYVMDNALLPYGLQTEDAIKTRLVNLVNKIDSNYFGSVDLIVIACNTASTYALTHIRQFTQTPIVGVVPAIKPAAQKTQTNHIALLATPATSRNQYTQSLVKEFATHCRVDFYSSTELVRLAEKKFWTRETVQAQVHNELQTLRLNTKTDILILGCTHFPILAQEIGAFFGSRINLIHSGKAIAKRVSQLLLPNVNEAGIKKPLQFFATAELKTTNSTEYKIKIVNI